MSHRLPRRLLGLGAVGVLAACGGDTLYSDVEVTGPHRGVAPHTVAVTAPERVSLPLGGPVPVQVTVVGGEGSDRVVRVGATGLAIDATGRDTVVLRGAQTLTTSTRRAQTVALSLAAIGIAPASLPRSLRLEVHAFAVTAEGACAAAVEATPQQLACATFRSDTIASGATGRPVALDLVTPHSVSVATTAGPAAAENETLVRATVTARSTAGAGGITRIGVTALAFDATGALLGVLRDSVSYSPPRAGDVSHDFDFSAEQLRTRTAGGNLPDTVFVEVHAFALHESGSCVAAATNAESRLPCASSASGRTAAGAAATRTPVALFRGRTVALPAGVRVGEVVIDQRLRRAYLSNVDAHRVEVVDLSTLAHVASVPVGSRPLGLTLDRTGDTLIVANSGGINLSFVPTSTLREDVARRFEIPRTRLYELRIDDHAQARFHTYSDRPGYLAADAEGRLIYSTVTTAAAPVGTVRVADLQPGWEEREPRILFHERALNRDSQWVALANVDSLFVLGPQSVLLFDHVPGSPDETIVGGPARVDEAVEELREQGSDVVAVLDAVWRVPEGVQLADTALVTASGDRSLVLVAEGLGTPSGRLMVWSAGLGALSEVEDVRDITNHTSDRIVDVALNENGTLGAARGERGAYFFSGALRLQGSALDGLEGRGGIDLLPGSTSSRTLAFVATERATVRVLETTHYTRMAELPVGATIRGPLRAAAPFAGENAGLSCGGDPLLADPRCLLARVVGVSDAGRLVVLEVRSSDLRRVQR